MKGSEPACKFFQFAFHASGWFFDIAVFLIDIAVCVQLAFHGIKDQLHPWQFIITAQFAYKAQFLARGIILPDYV